jgi:hypothetical protein
MKRLLLFCLLIITVPAWSSHIVGGEFEFTYISGNSYRLRLILYLDNKTVKSNPTVKGDFADVRIFNKKTDQIMKDVFFNNFFRLNRVAALEQMVDYTQIDCSKGEIETLKVVYEATLELDPDQYTEPQGYYIAWERCCRNYIISNIYSDDPQTLPNDDPYAGQTFYLEFPPLKKNGQRFINSSPRLFPPLNDYACPNRLYYVDFAGSDDDGDSLVYSLVTPLNTITADALPPGDLLPRPKPYPDIVWRPGFSETNMMQGAPDLKISKEGLLTVTPTISGLFAFAVKCEEFRDGEKIGELRRDFQMFVVDNCEPAEPPVIVAKETSADTYSPNLSVSFDNTVSDEDRCIEVKVTDADIESAAQGNSEKIKLRAIAIGFKADIKEVLPAVSNGVLSPLNPEKVFRICFDRCPYNSTGYFTIGIIAQDDACSLPLSDTTLINVYLEPPSNQDPFFETADVDDAIPVNVEKSWDISGTDVDLNPLEIEVLADGFDPAQYGMTIETLALTDGNYDARLTWDPNCDLLNFSERQDFNLKIVMNDVECDFNEPDTMIFDLHVDIPVNTAPVLTAESVSEVQIVNNTIAAEVDQPIVLNVVSKDSDILTPHNQISLVLDTELSDLPETYEFLDVDGVNNISSTFSWSPDCSIFDMDTWSRNYKFVFRTFDRSCVEVKADTVTIEATITDIDARREEFLPPNVITPNGDGYNEFFGLDEILKMSDTDVIPNLPLDNCRAYFVSIQIFNRWGKKVFESPRRNFRWYANNEAPGIYFYTIHYTDTDYKGTVSIK